MFTAGPSSTATSSAWHSSPKYSPDSRRSSRSKEQATQEPVG